MLIQEAVSTLDINNPATGTLQPYSPHTPATTRDTHRSTSTASVDTVGCASIGDSLAHTITQWQEHPRIVDIVNKAPFYALLPTYETCGIVRQPTFRVSLSRGKRSASLLSSTAVLFTGKALPAVVGPGMFFTLHGRIREVVSLESLTLTFRPPIAACVAHPTLRNSLWFRHAQQIADPAVVARRRVTQRMSTVRAMIYNAIICTDTPAE
jgi:hypothetical protein